MVDWRDILDWNQDQYAALRAEGYGFLAQGFYQKALVYFKALATIDPTNFYDVSTLGALYLQLKQFDEALSTLDQALALNPGHLPAQLNRAKALLNAGRVEEGLVIARRLAQIDDGPLRSAAEALIMAYS